MRRSLCLYALLIILGVPCQHAAAQARQEGAAKDMRDTLPTRVAQRMVDAYSQKDLDGSYAVYDTVYTHEYLGDPEGAKRVRRDDLLRQLTSDTAFLRRFLAGRFGLVRKDVFGPFVTLVWTSQGPGEELVKHFDLVEVRQGKIVREIETR